jgi:hypothetical protein
MKKNILAIGMVVVLITAGGIYWSSRNKSAPQDQSAKTETPELMVAEAGFRSLAIDPAKYESGWWAYKKGAKLAIDGYGFYSVLVKGYPTGTGVGEDFPDGLTLGEATLESGTQNSWSFVLPEGMLLTNLWVEGTTADGRMIKSQDLGNVGYDE